jgi:hypothetical protein
MRGEAGFGVSGHGYPPTDADGTEAAMNEQDSQGGDPEIGTCHMCGEEFPTQLELSKHLMDEHDEDGLPTPEVDRAET